MAICNLFLLLCFSCAMNHIACDSSNNSAVLISRYSKVAHWGQSGPLESRSSTEGRSSSGQALWTHRSDANIASGQNLKDPKPNVVYHYAVPSRKAHRYEDDALNTHHAIGEVQERFNAKPYFNYASAPPSRQNLPQNNNRPVRPSAFYDAPSPDIRATFPKTPPSDSYNSPFSSYNPPAISADGDKAEGPVYPPIDQVTPSDAQNNPVQPSEDTSPGYSYTPPSDGSGIYYDAPKKPSPQKERNKPQPSYGPLPDNSGKTQDSDHLFYPPNGMNQHDVILDHPPPGYEEADHQDSSDMNPMDNQNTMVGAADMAEGDLNPPPSDDFNPYLHGAGNPGDAHDFGAYDYDQHHVYQPVEHTTAPPPHDERVNKGHYSYYYLGRKLWYIPLYFSVYFIIYVTILILKSIARHKINFKHELHDKFHREARMMMPNEDIDQIHQNVTVGIDIMNKKYMM